MTLLGMATAATLVAPVALAVSCGDTSGGVTKAMGVDLKLSNPAEIWMVADGGSVQDKSFNEGALAGVAQFGNTSGKTYNFVQPKVGQLSNGYSSAFNGGAEVIVSAGFVHGDNNFNDDVTTDVDDESTKDVNENELGTASTAIKAHPEKWFIGADVDYSTLKSDGSDEQEWKNHMAGITYQTQKSGYWAGVYTAKYLNEHKDDGSLQTPKDGQNYSLDVAMYGGGAFPSVTSWMVGFEDGIKAMNLAHPDVNNKSWTPVNILPSRLTTDSFATPSSEAQNLTRQFVQEGADVIFPVAGPQIKDTLKATQGQKVKVIGVDGDQYAIYEDPRIIGSALKELQIDIDQALDDFYADTTEGKTDFVSKYHTKPMDGHVNFVFGKESDPFGEAQAQALLGGQTIAYPAFTAIPYGMKQDGNALVVDQDIELSQKTN